MISIIVAMAKNQVIGSNNRLPWKLPADLAFFKKVTTGHTVIMGRKTAQSIGRPLPNRRNIVITRNRNYSIEGFEICNSIDKALNLINNDTAFIIGGAEIYSEFLPYSNRLYITIIEAEFEGNTFFPKVEFEKWTLISKVAGEKNDKNPYNYYFATYERKL